jgi:glucuronate isomerase
MSGETVSLSEGGDMSASRLHPDRLFPAEPALRALARELYGSIAGLPLLSPHGHLDPAVFVDNAPMTGIGQALVGSDHYVVRLLHGMGIPLSEMLAGPDGPRDDRSMWHMLAAHWWRLAGTPSRVWLEQVVADVLGMEETPDAENADRLYDACAARLAAAPLRPRDVVAGFGLEVLTTTDSPLVDLGPHRALDADPGFAPRLLPTYRPDLLIDPARPGFAAAIEALGEMTGEATDTYGGYRAALAARRADFAAAGATASDHGVEISTTEHLGDEEARVLFDRVRTGRGDRGEIEAFRGHMMSEMAAMAADDGLVMQLHIGVVRDYRRDIAARYGPDVGQDFPAATEYTRTLRPLLERYGEAAGFRMVLYSVDETVFSREIGPLVSYFPGLYAGAPWWFLDAPDVMTRAFTAFGETAGLTKLAGFVDDSRALLSLGARHDVARRICCGYLARLVGEHRISLAEGERLARGYAYEQPRAVFRLGAGASAARAER